MSRSFELPEVDWATVGTVGPPGQRTFYLQARQGDQLITLKLEKQQVAAIAQFLGRDPLRPAGPRSPPRRRRPGSGRARPGRMGGRRAPARLRQRRRSHRDAGRGDRRGRPTTRRRPSRGGDRARSRGAGLGDSRADDASDRGVGRLSLTRTQAAAIVRRGWDLVKAGRPTCSLCGHPIDPEGHSCPRTNGHRPPAP